MKNLILAIESSCDDSCISIVDTDFNIIFEKKVDQSEFHKKYGGVVPELAARCHLEYIQMILNDLKELNLFSRLCCVCATKEPGLIGGLLVGVMTGKGISDGLNIPFFEINHLDGHIESVNIGIEKHIEYPFLTLLASGGHCQFILTREFCEKIIIGRTLDDSAGEAFDKIGKMLGIEYPAGKIIEQNALLCKNKEMLPIGSPMTENDINFSFSGFKTSVMRYIEKNKHLLNNEFINQICFSVQEKISHNLAIKTESAIKFINKNYQNINNFVLCGGVSANKGIISKIQTICQKNQFNLHTPQLKYATDNATMIAFVGIKKYLQNNNIILH